MLRARYWPPRLRRQMHCAAAPIRSAAAAAAAASPPVLSGCASGTQRARPDSGNQTTVSLGQIDDPGSATVCSARPETWIDIRPRFEQTEHAAAIPGQRPLGFRHRHHPALLLQQLSPFAGPRAATVATALYSDK
jgi:protein tyrosine phosphatase (PTP) superfamily phosphohydrolase (DUF442 family)